MSLDLPPICIYRSDILPWSETFIPAQAEAMARYCPFYLGCRRVRGIDLPPARTRIVNRGGPFGRAREIAFKLSAGLVPDMGIAWLRPVLLHAHFGPDAVEVLRLVKRLNVPLVFTAHGYDFTQSDRELGMTHKGARFVRRRRWLARDASRVIAISRFMADHLASRSIPAEKIAVHYIGVDTSLFRANAGVTDTRVVLFVGRLIERKGCDHAIRAVAEVQRSISDVELVVIGDGPLRGDLELLADRSLRRCTFLGAQSNQSVRDWMSRAAVFCTPSLNEPLGIVFLEAQAMGVPVAGFASGGIPEAVIHGATGLLAPERNTAALSANLARLLTDPFMRQRFSEAAVRHVRASFDLHRQTELLEDIYDDVIRERRHKRVYA